MLRKLREGATTMVSWEKSPKKEGVYRKREIDTERLQKKTDRLQKSDIDFKILLIPLLTKFVVSAFWEYKTCSVLHFFTKIDEIPFFGYIQ